MPTPGENEFLRNPSDGELVQEELGLLGPLNPEGNLSATCQYLSF